MENHKLLPLFGSQLVNSNSKTPYSDATQVGINFFYVLNLFSPLSPFCPQFNVLNETEHEYKKSLSHSFTRRIFVSSILSNFFFKIKVHNLFFFLST